MKNRILLENDIRPVDLEAKIEAIVDHQKVNCITGASTTSRQPKSGAIVRSCLGFVDGPGHRNCFRPLSFNCSTRSPETKRGRA